jgi:hypothetical protein
MIKWMVKQSQLTDSCIVIGNSRRQRNKAEDGGTAFGVWTWDASSNNTRRYNQASLTLKNVAFWDVAPCRACMNRRFGRTYRLHLQGRKILEWETSVSRWLQTAADSSLADFSSLNMEAICSSETSVHTRSTRLQPAAHAGSSLVAFSTLKMKAIRSAKRRFTQDLHGATSQKTTFFIVTAVKTSNLTTLKKVRWSCHCAQRI